MQTKTKIIGAAVVVSMIGLGASAMNEPQTFKPLATPDVVVQQVATPPAAAVTQPTPAVIKPPVNKPTTVIPPAVTKEPNTPVTLPTPTKTPEPSSPGAVYIDDTPNNLPVIVVTPKPAPGQK